MKTTYTLAIPYSNASARSRAKKAGATWDAGRKVWILTIAEDRFHFYPQLHDFVVNNESAAPKMVDSGAGFMMENTSENAARVARLGFDAIED